MPHHGNMPHGIKMRIPWRFHKKAWEVYAKRYPGQSAEKMAERGGFGLMELVYLLAGEDPYDMHDGDDTLFTDFFGKFEPERKP